MKMLITTLDQASQLFLEQTMRSAPFDHLDLDKAFCTLYQSSQDLPESVVADTATYLTTPVKVDYWYDAALNRTNLVLVVKSQEIDTRFRQLEALGYPSIVPFSSYVAHVTLVWGLPALSSSIKSFVNSLNMTFNSRSGNLMGFKGETLVDDSGLVPNVEGQEFFIQHRHIKK